MLVKILCVHDPYMHDFQCIESALLMQTVLMAWISSKNNDGIECSMTEVNKLET